MRDLTGEHRTRYRSWVMAAFSTALQGEDDPVTRAREGLKFNPAAIAFAGIAYAMAESATREQVAALLALVHRPAAAHGFIAAASAVAAGNDRLPQATVRCALRASIYATRHWDGRDEDLAARVQQHRRAASVLPMRHASSTRFNRRLDAPRSKQAATLARATSSRQPRSVRSLRRPF